MSARPPEMIKALVWLADELFKYIIEKTCFVYTECERKWQKSAVAREKCTDLSVPGK